MQEEANLEQEVAHRTLKIQVGGWGDGGGEIKGSEFDWNPDVEDSADKGRAMKIQLFLVEEEEEVEKNLYFRLRKQMLYMNESSRLEEFLLMVL